MQFQLATDYAIRILGYLYHHKNDLATAANMSEELGVTYLYFMKIISKLKASGVVRSVQGCNGGYQLAVPAEEISLYDVIDIMEGGIHINRCLQEDGFCSNGGAPDCRVRQYLVSLQGGLVNRLKEKYISEF
ncbi:MAG TPA: Rrf2 family transcriptional regulator [Clostridiales bacterium]|nr:Rrf2 family transcriptional regulator [Clostridiales bacterium]